MYSDDNNNYMNDDVKIKTRQKKKQIKNIIYVT